MLIGSRLLGASFWMVGGPTALLVLYGTCTCIKENCQVKKIFSLGNRSGKPLGPRPKKPTFGRKLKVLQGLKPNEEMEKILGGIAHSAYARYLNGQTAPVSRQLAALRAATGVCLNWLVMDADTRTGPILASGPGVEVEVAVAGVDQSASEIVAAKNETIALLRADLEHERERANRAEAELREVLKKMRESGSTTATTRKAGGAG